ncbi:MAG: class IV adenylate cyclase [Candidatus Omnitrophota bacterium]
MPKEIETKFKIDSVEKFKRNLKKIGARFVSKEFEQDTYYRSPAPQSSCSTIRLRSITDKGVFTLKGAAGGAPSRTYKVRSELEVGINDVRAFDEILKQLGFMPRFKKEKIRETYKWKDAKISLDKLPFIGFYTEIEGPKRTIKEAAALLGLEMSRAIPDTYMELFNYYKMLRKKPALRLVFKSERKRHD